MGASSVIQVAAIAVAHDYINRERAKQRSGRSPAQRRRRISIPEVFNSMGPRIFRRAFRMTLDSFWRLHSILLPHIRTAANATSGYERKGGRNGGNYSLPPIPNGPITSSICLGAALRYFAGGSAYDIICVFAISLSVNCSDFDISYPETIEEQRSKAAGFESASAPGIRNCAGAIDGILIWMLKPSLEEAKKTGVDQKRYLCGRKHKFGLNCQAVSDC